MLLVLASGDARADSFRLEKWPQHTPTPDLRVLDIDAHSLDLLSLRGKVILLNYWASWCEPCVNEFAALNALAESEAAGRGLIVIGVNFCEPISKIRQFQALHRARFTMVVDKTGESFKQWTKGVLPTTVLIGRNGRARWRIIGELDTKNPKFAKVLEQLLQEAASGNASSEIIVK